MKISESAQNNLRKVWISIVCLGLLIQTFFYLAPILVPDEQNFWGRAEGFFPDAQSIQYLWTQKNTIGYGSLFWILLTGTKFISMEYGFVLFRGLVLLLWIVLILQATSREKDGLRVLSFGDEEFLFLFLSAPFWWYGKLASPEILSCQLGFLGLWLQVKKRPLAAAFLIGLASGFKPTSIVFGIFYLIFISDFKTLIFAALTGLAGLICSNPVLLIHPVETFLQFFSAKNAFLLSWSHFYKVLFGEYWEWDIIFSGSLFSWIINPLTLGILFFLSWKKSKRLSVAFLLSLLGNLLLVLTNSRFLGWYWLPFFFVTLFVVSQLKPFPSVQWKWALVLSLLLTSPAYIFRDIQIRGWQVRNHLRWEKQRQCLLGFANHPRTSIATIIDLYEFTEPLFEPPTQLPYPPKKYISNWAATDWLTNAGIRNGALGSEHTFPPLLVFLNPRSIRHRPYQDFKKYYEQRRPHDEVIELGSCSSTKVLWIQ